MWLSALPVTSCAEAGVAPAIVVVNDPPLTMYKVCSVKSPV